MIPQEREALNTSSTGLGPTKGPPFYQDANIKLYLLGIGGEQCMAFRLVVVTMTTFPSTLFMVLDSRCVVFRYAQILSKSRG